MKEKNDLGVKNFAYGELNSLKLVSFESSGAYLRAVRKTTNGTPYSTSAHPSGFQWGNGVTLHTRASQFRQDYSF